MQQKHSGRHDLCSSFPFGSLVNILTIVALLTPLEINKIYSRIRMHFRVCFVCRSLLVTPCSVHLVRRLTCPHLGGHFSEGNI